MNDVEQERARRMQEAMRGGSDISDQLLADAWAEIERLYSITKFQDDEIERLRDYKRRQAEDIINLGQQVGKLEDCNAELLAALREAIEILEGDGEYPETAKRFRHLMT